MMKQHQGLHDLLTFEQSKARLRSLLSEFIAAREMVAVQHPAQSPEQLHWEQLEQFPLKYMLNGRPTERFATQVDFASEFVSSVQILLNMSVSEFRHDNRMVFFVLSNDDTLHTIMEGSMQLRLAKFTQDFAVFSYTVIITCRQTHVPSPCASHVCLRSPFACRHRTTWLQSAC
jgi:hypothetical protein